MFKSLLMLSIGTLLLSSVDDVLAQEQKVLPGQITSSDKGAGPLNIDLKHTAVASDIPDKAQYSILRNLYFDFNNASLKKNALDDILPHIISFMKTTPEAELKLIGHADELGSKRDNLKVSQQRAQSVKSYLVQQGIASERILIHFRGEEEPLASNDDNRDGRELNRRVEIFLLMPEGS